MQWGVFITKISYINRFKTFTFILSHVLSSCALHQDILSLWQTSQVMYKESWTKIILCSLPQSTEIGTSIFLRKRKKNVRKQKEKMFFFLLFVSYNFFLAWKICLAFGPVYSFNFNAFYSILVFIMLLDAITVSDAKLIRAFDFFPFFSFSHYFFLFFRFRI